MNEVEFLSFDVFHSFSFKSANFWLRQAALNKGDPPKVHPLLTLF